MFLFILIFLVVALTFYFVVRFLKNKTKKSRLTTVYYPPAPAPAPSGIPEKQLTLEEAIKKVFIVLSDNPVQTVLLANFITIISEDTAHGTGTGYVGEDYGFSWAYEPEILTLFSRKDQPLRSANGEVVFAYWKGPSPPETITFPPLDPLPLPPLTQIDYKNPAPPYAQLGVYATDEKSITINFKQVNFLTESIYLALYEISK